MKLNTTGYIALLAMGGLLAFGANAQAEPNKTDRPEVRRPGGPDHAGAPDRLKRIADELQLTEDQKEKLKPIFREEGEKMKALREDTSLGREEKMAKFKEIRESIGAKIKPILTAEQWEKWQKLRDDAPGRPRKQ